MHLLILVVLKAKKKSNATIFRPGYPYLITLLLQFPWIFFKVYGYGRADDPDSDNSTPSSPSSLHESLETYTDPHPNIGTLPSKPTITPVQEAIQTSFNSASFLPSTPPISTSAYSKASPPSPIQVLVSKQANEPVQNTPKESIKEPVQIVTQESTQEAQLLEQELQPLALELTQTLAQESPQNSAKEHIQKLTHESVHYSDPTCETAINSTTVDSTQDLTQNNVHQPSNSPQNTSLKLDIVHNQPDQNISELVNNLLDGVMTNTIPEIAPIAATLLTTAKKLQQLHLLMEDEKKKLYKAEHAIKEAAGNDQYEEADRW
jgi:hypothetical protein